MNLDWSLTELSELLSEIYNLGLLQKSPVKQLPADQLSEALMERLDWKLKKVSIGLNQLMLGPRDEFLNPPDASAVEVYPWRFNRAWSYLRRPLIVTGYDSNSIVLWGNGHIMLSLRYVADLCLSGKIKANSARLKRVLGRFREKESKAFEESVRKIVEDLTGMPAKGRLRKIGHHKIMCSGRDLGDIDVLGVLPHKKMILCIECKDFALARTPAEIQHQLEELLVESTGNKPTVQKHLERAKWIEDHIDEVLQECFGITRKGRWKVKPVLVSDTELYVSHLAAIPFPMWSIETLRGMTMQNI